MTIPPRTHPLHYLNYDDPQTPDRNCEECETYLSAASFSDPFTNVCKPCETIAKYKAEAKLDSQMRNLPFAWELRREVAELREKVEELEGVLTIVRAAFGAVAGGIAGKKGVQRSRNECVAFDDATGDVAQTYAVRSALRRTSSLKSHHIDGRSKLPQFFSSHNTASIKSLHFVRLSHGTVHERDAGGRNRSYTDLSVGRKGKRNEPKRLV